MCTKTKNNTQTALWLARIFCSGLLVGMLGRMMPAVAQPFSQRQVQTQLSNMSVSGRHSSDGQTMTASPQSLRQHERIYLSVRGEFMGAHTIFGGTILFIDRGGAIELAARDYTAELDYDYTGRLNRIGAATIAYDYRGRVEQVGSRMVAYDFRSRLEQIGSDVIAYTSRGKVSQVGNVTIQYDRGHIDTISVNYTSAGTRIVVVRH